MVFSYKHYKHYRHCLRDCREFQTLAKWVVNEPRIHTKNGKKKGKNPECNKFTFPDGTNKNVFSYHKF